ncbi:hypothetical protein L9F63_028046, partial [Diploptera punctata]
HKTHSQTQNENIKSPHPAPNRTRFDGDLNTRLKCYCYCQDKHTQIVSNKKKTASDILHLTTLFNKSAERRYERIVTAIAFESRIQILVTTNFFFVVLKSVTIVWSVEYLSSTPSKRVRFGAGNLAIGIGIQNFPEGLAVSLPLHAAGFSTWRSFLYCKYYNVIPKERTTVKDKLTNFVKEFAYVYILN